MNRIALQIGIGCVALFGLAACGDPDPIINIPDSGTTPDSGGGVDSGPVVEPDSGPGPDTCPPATAPGPMAAVLGTCSAEVRTCVAEATSQAELQACFTADAENGMNCFSCLNAEQLNTCSATGVCDEEFGEVGCCITDAGCTTQACVEMVLAPGGACAAVGTAFQSCANGALMAMECGNTDICNADEPPPAAFAPDFGRRPSRVPSLLEHMVLSALR